MSHQNVSDLFNKMSLSEEEEKECPICCETFDKYEHAAINCSKCRMSCCRSCYKTQFLNWNKPRCMFEECKHPFEQDFLASKFPKAYLDKELKDHRKTVLLDIEKAMLPAASAALGRENKAKKAIEECAKKFTVWRKVCTDFSKISSKFHAASNREVTRLSKKLLKEKYEELAKAPKVEDQALPFANQHQQIKLTQYSFRSEARKQLHPKYLTPMQYSALDELIEIDPSYSDAMHTPDEWYQIAVQNERDTRRRMTRATYIINNLHEELDIDDEGNTPAAKEKKDVFHFRCPVGECRGFLDKQYECTVCLTKCCRSCVVPKKDGEKHECKEADLESIKMIRSETKPCPSCSSRIMKISGCDQIFCTSCNIAFDWKTGEVDNGPIHNPHYYEWLQKTGRVDDRHLRNVNPQVNMCGRRDLTGAFATWIDDNIPYNSGFLRPHTQIETIHEIIRAATHLRYDVYTRYTVDQNKDNLKLRIRYIKNDISEKQWKIMLHKYFKAAEFNKHIQNLIVMFNDATIQTVNDMLDINPSRERVPDQLGGERKLTRQERKDKCIDLINKCLATLKTLVEYWQENTVQLCSKYDYCYHRRLNLAEFMFKTYFESLGIKPIEVKEKPKKKVNKKVDVDKSQVDSEEEESE